MKILFAILLFPIIIKGMWIIIFRLKNEKKDNVERANYLISKVATSPKQLLSEMPSQISLQFQGEWAIYSCSMTCKALANIAEPCYKEQIIKIIKIALSKEIRKYDTERWNEDPLEGLDGNLSHLSYYSHLAWMIGEYKSVYDDNQFDSLYHSLCQAMYKRINNSPIVNIPTYPHEQIYIPDMLVAIVALHIYNKLYDGKYKNFVNKWMNKAKTEWIDKETGLLASFMTNDGIISRQIKGSYSALNCYYLALIDTDFAKQQFQRLKTLFKQSFPITGIKEYHQEKCLFGYDIDAGPILFNLSPSGTAFAIGVATMCDDHKFRRKLLTTAEIVGTTVAYKGHSHYLLANLVLVGEAITLAMKTSEKINKKINNLKQ